MVLATMLRWANFRESGPQGPVTLRRAKFMEPAGKVYLASVAEGNVTVNPGLGSAISVVQLPTARVAGEVIVVHEGAGQRAAADELTHIPDMGLKRDD